MLYNLPFRRVDYVDGYPVPSSLFDIFNDYTEQTRAITKLENSNSKKMGEVLTPISLVLDMLNKLPKEVWSNPNLKWLDPCAGSGVFTAVIYYKLMDGLAEFEPDACKRYVHIMENMIYSCELQGYNVSQYGDAYNRYDELQLNLYYGSYLDSEFNEYMKTVWKLDEFDIVVMNPPYNSDINHGSSHTLWDKFVKNSFNHLKENGYLVAVHPSGWRNVSGGFKDIQNILKSKQMEYLEIHNVRDGIQTFGVETRYDFYCLCNIENKFSTNIKGQDGKIYLIDIKNLEFIPNEYFYDIDMLLAKGKYEKLNVLRNCKYHTQKKYVDKIESEDFKYPVVYTVPKNHIPKLRYSKYNSYGHYDVPKLIWSNGRVMSVGSVLDVKGEYAVSEFAYAIIDEPQNLQDIKKVFDSKTFRDIMEACAVSEMVINWKVLKLFRKDFYKLIH